MNQNILSQVPGGKVYNTNYRAALDQISEYGTDDVCFIIFLLIFFPLPSIPPSQLTSTYHLSLDHLPHSYNPPIPARRMFYSPRLLARRLCNHCRPLQSHINIILGRRRRRCRCSQSGVSCGKSIPSAGVGM